MILKRNTQYAISFQLVLLFLALPLIFRSQNTLPTTTVTGCLKVDSTMSTGNLQSMGNLDVGGSGRIDSSLVVGDTMKAEDIIVTGNAKISGDINLSGKLLYDVNNNLGIGFVPGPSSGTGGFFLGKSVAGPVVCSAIPQSALNFSIGANMQIFDPVNPTTSGLLNLQTWTGGSSIDASTGGSVSASGLLLNYWCGNNTFINTGANGGAVYVGNDLYANKNVQVGNPGQALDPNVSLNLFLNGTNSGLKLWSGANPNVKLIHDNYEQFMVMGNGKTSIGVNSVVGATPYKTLTVNGDAAFANYGAADGANAFEILGNNQTPTNRGISLDNNSNVAFFVNSTSAVGSFKFKNGTGPTYDLMDLDVYGKLALTSYSTEAIVVKNFGTGFPVFTVKSNGATYIGTKKPLSAGIHNDALLAVYGKVIATSFYITNANGIWADYVFEKNYKRMPIEELELYLIQNKHLPGVITTKEVEQNGFDVATTQAKLLEKLEESYLYIVELHKRIEALERKMN